MPWTEDVFRELEREMEQVGREFDRFFRWARERAAERPGPGGPFVRGYVLTVGPDGVPRFERFGNVPGPGMEGGTWEPYADVALDEDAGRVRVTVDLPGVEKDDVHLKVSDGALHVRAEGGQRRYAKALRLPEEVRPDSADAQFRNGVLDVTLDLARPAPHAAREVHVR